jgi:hypothetical protein
MIRAAGAAVSTPAAQAGDPGSNPRAALHSPRAIEVRTIAPAVARDVFERHHYLHSMPAGTRLCFGAFVGDRLLGAVSLGVGPLNAYRLVEGALRTDCLTLTRLWLDDALPKNSESCVLGVVVRALRRFSKVRFLVAYSDPRAGHVGTVYQAAGWLYTGTGEDQPLMDLGDGVPRHLRTVASAFGTHSARYFRRLGLPVRFVPVVPKHRYVVFVDPSWRDRLPVPVLPYPKKREVASDGGR